MNEPSRIPAVLAYIPVLGWVYVLLFQRQNPLAVYHVRQSIGLFLFLIGALVAWAVIAWVLAWVPFGGVIGVAFFTLVMAAYFFGFFVWIMGIINALRNRSTPLPAFGRWASRLPIR